MLKRYQRSPDEQLIIGITGRIGSGKTSVGTHLSSNCGFQYLRYSKVLSDWSGEDPDGKDHLQEVGWEVMAGGKQSELNRRLIAQITPNTNVAVDGLRHPLDCESLNFFSDSFHLLYIDSSAADRWERLNINGRYSNYGLFQDAETHPVEQQIDLFRSIATFVIHNSGSLQDLYAAVDEALAKLGKKAIYESMDSCRRTVRL
jgi:dephospho-CoA kinase